ncbi:MAG TPA: hypothetical protein VG759_08755 [Candidatus Angelobacter sp.]|jgi:hypothetical protein|nr:hypothetical protein [Candidatus Angelobacter sp.]
MIVKCGRCGSNIPESNDRCPTCGEHAGFPNIREVDSQEEQEALTRRYDAMVAKHRSDGTSDVLDSFEEALENSVAVVACDLHFARQLMTSSKTLYNNYYMGVTANIRKPATLEDDRNRRVADSILFNGYAQEIVFAALSLTGLGLSSYGRYFMTLRDITIANRATVLEENSFTFVQKHCKVLERPPLGYRATWPNRHKLGVAKLGTKITASTQNAHFASMVLSDGGERQAAEFIEVHIYGPFDGNAVESVAGSLKPGNEEEEIVAYIVRGVVISSGKKWVDL